MATSHQTGRESHQPESPAGRWTNAAAAPARPGQPGGIAAHSRPKKPVITGFEAPSPLEWGDTQVGPRRANVRARGTGEISSSALCTLLVWGVAFLARSALGAPTSLTPSARTSPAAWRRSVSHPDQTHPSHVRRTRRLGSRGFRAWLVDIGDGPPGGLRLRVGSRTPDQFIAWSGGVDGPPANRTGHPGSAPPACTAFRFRAYGRRHYKGLGR